MYYEHMLKEQNTALRFGSFTNGDGIPVIVPRVSDNLAIGEWERHTLEDMICNDTHQPLIMYWSCDIIKSMTELMRQAAYSKHLVYSPQHCFNCDRPPTHHYSEIHTVQ